MSILTEAVKLLRATGISDADIRRMFDEALPAPRPITFPTNDIASRIDDLLATHSGSMNDKQLSLCRGIADFSKTRKLSDAQMTTVNNIAMTVRGSAI